jgi:hypothetical protein
MRWCRFSLLLLAIGWLAGCSVTGPHRDISGEVPAQKAAAEIPEAQLLDVWIELFDPGELPDDPEEASGLSMDIRAAEARYMPERLRETMERTGYWGAVRVVPRGTAGSEVLVRGTILVSDGERLALRITALDASGREWHRGSYEAEITAADYPPPEQPDREAFQSLYNAIANDLARFRTRLSREDIVTIRRTAALQFAADLAPDAFAGYLRQDDDDNYTVARLPAQDDPMYRRVNAIRERDFLLIDTLNGHFDNFYREVQEPYNEWRRTRSEEAAAMREIRAEANKRKVLGALAVLGAIAIEAAGSNSTRRATGGLRNVMIVGGAYAIKTGFDKDSETAIHRDAIEELGASFASETRPLVVDVEGETHELTGSAEEQYTKWRALLKEIYASETGLVTSGE